jgi:hypothetical protein
METLFDASKEVVLEINENKTKCMCMSHHQTTGHSYCIKVHNESFENMSKLKYLGIMVTNKNCIYKKIRSKLSWEMLATTQFRIFCLPICCLKLLGLKCFVWV